MFTKIQYGKIPLLQEEAHTLIQRDGTLISETEPLLSEHLLSIYVEGILTLKLICLGAHLEELVLGRLFSEGILTIASDISSISFDETMQNAYVQLSASSSFFQKRCTQPDYVETIPSASFGKTVVQKLIPEAQFYPVTPINWKAEWIFSLADTFSKGMPLHSETWATHSCILALQDQILFSCEDIGRHNAIDKVVGYCLKNGIDRKNCIIYSSGRIPTDMVTKAIRAGFPVLASKASPTKEAIQLARKYDLTLICQARKDRMKVYAGTVPSPLI